MYDFEANKVIARQIGKPISFLTSNEKHNILFRCSSVSNCNPDCAEEQPDLLWDPKRAAREGARADRKGDIFSILKSVS